MKNIFKIFSSENLKKNIKTIWDRFPISIIIVFLVAGLFFAELHYNNDISDFYNKRIFIATLSLIMIFIFSIATYLSTENFENNKLQRNLLQIIPIIFGVIFYNIFSFDKYDFENFLFFFLTFSGIIAFLFFAPYLKNLKVKRSIFYTYFYNISVVILISFIFAGVLFGLGTIGITAVDILFNLDISQKNTYGNWAILSLSITAPLFALTQIPNKKSFSENHFNENAFFSFLIKFVAIPFIYLYFFILYVYSIKVLANFGDWPKGEVSWLVIGFSIFGYLAYSFSYIFEEKNKLIKSFRKIFPYAVIPQVFMLFYAIYLRLGQYDLTVNRYFVVVFGLWLLLTSLHFIFSKKKNLIAIPAGLALFIIIISIIPKFNVYNYPEERQLNRLETNLKKAKILSTEGFNPLITPLKNYSDISQDLSKNIYSGIDYLCDFNNCKSIKELFPKIYSEIEEKDKEEWEKNIKEQIKNIEKNKDKKECKYNKHGYLEDYSEKCFNKKRLEELKIVKYEGPIKWEIIDGVTEKIKVKEYFDENLEEKKYINFSVDNQKRSILPLYIKGYSEMYEISHFEKWANREDYAEYNARNQEIILKIGKNSNKVSIKKISEVLLKKYGKENNKKLNKEDLTFDLENGKYKMIFREISILNPEFKENNENGNYYSNYTSGYLLVK